MKPTQDGRPARFHSPLGKDELLLVNMAAREAVSNLFEYDLIVYGEDEDLDMYSLLGEHVYVEFDLTRGKLRYFSGHVSDITFHGYRENFVEFRLILRPWLWLLTRASNNRIFQNISVPKIIESVCKDHGFTDIKDKLTATYPDREYCVQYRESDFDFIARLMEEEGIYYYFEHSDTKHTMVLADPGYAPENFEHYDKVPWIAPDSQGRAGKEHLSQWSSALGVRNGTVSLRDFDFTKPGADMNCRSVLEKGHSNATFERYEYPGGYSSTAVGDALSRTRREEYQADHSQMCGSGNVRGLVPGFAFELEDFQRADQNQNYLVLSVTHRIDQGGYDSSGAAASGGTSYDCFVTALPDSEPFRPSRSTPKPRMFGPQTAIVVGDAGDEIHTNQHGQIRVQFHWDREGNSDQNSSCWVRVAQVWAGNKWGAQFIPRVGHEVIVDFLDGDPDRPIVTGSVYNGTNKPPYDLPANATQSGIKTRSSKSGTNANFNEIRFEDKKGSEELYVHAERNMKVKVEKDRVKDVDANETVTIGGNRTQTIDGVDTQTVKKEQNITVQKKRMLNVQNDEARIIWGNSEQGITKKWKTNAALGVEIKTPLQISLKAGVKIKLDAPTIERTDASWISTSSHSLAFNGIAMAVSGSTIDIKGNATGLFVNNIGINATNLGFNGVDISGNGIDLDDIKAKIKNRKLELKKKQLELIKTTLKLMKGSLDLKKTGLDIGKMSLQIKG